MKLTVVAIQAKDIPKMGFLTKADPYLVMRLSSSPQEFRTNYIENTLNPIWNQRFDFTINDQSTDVLIVQMKDWDTVDQHKIISRLEIPLRTLPTGQQHDMWFDMIPCTDKNFGGRVRLLILISMPTINQQPGIYGNPRAIPPPAPPGYHGYNAAGQIPQTYQMRSGFNGYPGSVAGVSPHYYGYPQQPRVNQMQQGQQQQQYYQYSSQYPGSPSGYYQNSPSYPGSPQQMYQQTGPRQLAPPNIKPASDPYAK